MCGDSCPANRPKSSQMRLEAISCYCAVAKGTAKPETIKEEVENEWVLEQTARRKRMVGKDIKAVHFSRRCGAEYEDKASKRLSA